MADIVVVFDFDKTIIDVDSDDWVVDEFGFTDLFNQLLPVMPLNSLMDRMMKEIHSRGKTIDEVAEVLKRVPIHPRVVPAIKAAHANGCDLRIVSDSNTFFIETIMNHLGIRECFTEINTNPSFIEEERLRVLPYHDFNRSSHGCNLCPPNMCKGEIVEKIQNSIQLEGKKRTIYLGDGIGDYCPSLRLHEKDFVLPRKNFPAWELISKNPLLIKAKIREWSDGEELEKVLTATIDYIAVAEREVLLIAQDLCKSEIITGITIQEITHNVLPVHQ